jgi:peptidylprolyl isomerase
VKTLALSALFALLSAGCYAQTDSETPMPPTDLADELRSDWRDIAPENLFLMDTVHGRVVIEINSDFAPGHSDQFRTLSRQGVYNGSRFYRVIDGFVAQGGLQDETVISTHPTLKNENDRPISKSLFVEFGNADLFAPIVGHIDGFPVGRSESLGKEWLLHCPGALAMARDNDPDSGGTEFYIVLDAQRYLDRNLTVFGRVIEGMEYVQKLKRGVRSIESGVIQAPDKGDEIIAITVAADLPESDRPTYRVMTSASDAFEAAKTAKRVRNEDFFYRKPPEVLDICGFEVPFEKSTPQKPND